MAETMPATPEAYQKAGNGRQHERDDKPDRGIMHNSYNANMQQLSANRYRSFALVLALCTGLGLAMAGTATALPGGGHLYSAAPRAQISPSSPPVFKPQAAKIPAWIRRIQAVLRLPNQARAFWGIYIYSLDHHRILFQHNGYRLFVPASNTKLFTISAALCRLGPNYRFHTQVRAFAAPDAQGRVVGDVVLVGEGDPTLSGRLYPYPNPHLHLKPNPPDQAMAALAEQIAARGVKSITGDIVGDDTYFRYQPYPEGWAQDDLMWGYGAAISALTVNDNQYWVHIRPGASAGALASISIRPWVGAFRVDNELLTTAAGGPRVIEIDRRVDSNTIHFWGTLPLGSNGDRETLSVGDPALFAARLLKRDLERQGIVVYGKARARHCLPFPQQPGLTAPVCTPTAALIELAELTSPPLSEDLQWILKVSQNLHAELMLRLLGKTEGGDGSIKSGLLARQAFLAQVGIKPHDVFFRDGSGLSRETLVQPRAIVRLLRYMARQPAPIAADFRSYLPIAGVDGTLDNRFLNTPAAGDLLGKTGFVEHDRALSGYAVTQGGDHLAYSIIVNNDNMKGPQMRSAIDRIALAMIQH